MILPDSRTRYPGTLRGHHPIAGVINWNPVFCANCGKPYGWVPESVEFACYLCDPCSSHWGQQFGMALMPDEVFWQKVHHEMRARYGRVLTDKEVQAHMQFSCNPLSKLLKERL